MVSCYRMQYEEKGEQKGIKITLDNFLSINFAYIMKKLKFLVLYYLRPFNFM